MSSTETVDCIQYHMLNMIAGIMHGYSLNPSQVKAQYEYVSTIDPSTVTHKYDKDVWAQPFVTPIDTKNDVEQQEETKEVLYVESRRDFCLALGKGKKICPSYSSCTDQSCKHFHIRSEFICPHVSRGSSFCEEEDCELIVIRACRKGKRCNDAKCSFRH